MKRRILVSGLIATSLVGGLGWNATQAHAAPTPPPTLTGELLGSSREGNSSTIACDAQGGGTLTFTINGTARGPYPGTFTETGTATVADTFTTKFQADFTITSGAVTVKGHKSFSSSNANDGYCFQPAQQANSIDTYQATITTANGTYSDAGTAVTILLLAVNTDPTYADFGERFNSSQSTTTLIPPVCTSNCGTAATPELGSGELLATGLLPLGAVLLYRRRRARRTQQ